MTMRPIPPCPHTQEEFEALREFLKDATPLERMLAKANLNTGYRAFSGPVTFYDPDLSGKITETGRQALATIKEDDDAG